MNWIPKKEKPLIDLTKEDDRNRIDELEAEVERLNEVVTTLAMGRDAAYLIKLLEKNNDDK